jgi:hypothetical protein
VERACPKGRPGGQGHERILRLSSTQALLHIKAEVLVVPLAVAELRLGQAPGTSALQGGFAANTRSGFAVKTPTKSIYGITTTR